MSNQMISRLSIGFILLFSSCRPEEDSPLTNPTPGDTQVHYFSSLQDLFSRNAEPTITREVMAENGGSFTTSHGSIVTIPANAFVTAAGSLVSGQVKIEFKDVFDKSEMLFSGLSTHLTSGEPLKSAGMFFIRASKNGDFLQLNSGKKIEVVLPNDESIPDSEMEPFVMNNGVAQGWSPPVGEPTDSLFAYLGSYLYSIYNFNVPADSGSWCNSDNAVFFSAYPQTVLTLNPDLANFNTIPEMFLVFHQVPSLVHVYDEEGNYPYYFAPVGFSCTAVSVLIQDGKIYACFTPVTITDNMTVDLQYVEMTEEAFVASVMGLND